MKKLALLVLLLPAVCRAQCDRFPYYVQPIATLGGTDSYAIGINGLGQVTGYSRDSGGVYRAFATDANLKVHAVDTGITTASFGQAINDAGWAAGYAAGTTSDFGFVWTGGATSFLMNNLGGDGLYVLSVNNNGMAAGYQFNAARRGRPFRTDVSMGIHQLPLTTSGSYAGVITINDARQCAGYGDYWDGEEYVDRALRWEANDQPTVLGTLGGYHSYGYTINMAGQVAGESERADGAYHAFRTRPGSLQMDDLGALNGIETSVNGINAAGDVVGASYVYVNPDFVPQKAFVYAGAGPIKDLNTLVDPALGWTLIEAIGINDRSQIVGWGRRNGLSRGFRATPTGTPFPYGDVDADGAVALTDVTLLLRVAAGLETAYDLLAGDVAPAPACNGRGFGDDKITIADAARVARRLSGLETQWP